MVEAVNRPAERLRRGALGRQAAVARYSHTGVAAAVARAYQDLADRARG